MQSFKQKSFHGNVQQKNKNKRRNLKKLKTEKQKGHGGEITRSLQGCRGRELRRQGNTKAQETKQGQLNTGGTHENWSRQSQTGSEERKHTRNNDYKLKRKPNTGSGKTCDTETTTHTNIDTRIYKKHEEEIIKLKSLLIKRWKNTEKYKTMT